MPELYILSMSFIIAMVVAAIIYRSWSTRTGSVPSFIAQAERTNLLEAIEASATEPQMHITLSRFWRGRGWNRRQRYCLLRPLIAKRVLHIPYSEQPAQRFLETLWFRVLMQPPNTVVLNSRDWTRMATDRSGREPSIIIQRISGGMNQIGGSHNTMSQQEFSAEQVTALIGALQRDGEASAEIREAADAVADDLQTALEHESLPDVAKGVRAATALAESAAGLMQATRKVLDLLGL